VLYGTRGEKENAGRLGAADCRKRFRGVVALEYAPGRELKFDTPLKLMAFGVDVPRLVVRELPPSGVFRSSVLFTTLDSLLDGPFGWLRMRRVESCAADARFAGLSTSRGASFRRGAGGVRPASVSCRDDDWASSLCGGWSERHDENRKLEKKPVLLGVESILLMPNVSSK
jgi:hypothetical protein